MGPSHEAHRGVIPTPVRGLTGLCRTAVPGMLDDMTTTVIGTRLTGDLGRAMDGQLGDAIDDRVADALEDYIAEGRLDGRVRARRSPGGIAAIVAAGVAAVLLPWCLILAVTLPSTYEAATGS